MISLGRLFENAGDTGLFREPIGFSADKGTDLDACKLARAGYVEKGAAREV